MHQRLPPRQTVGLDQAAEGQGNGQGLNPEAFTVPTPPDGVALQALQLMAPAVYPDYDPPLALIRQKNGHVMERALSACASASPYEVQWTGK